MNETDITTTFKEHLKYEIRNEHPLLVLVHSNNLNKRNCVAMLFEFYYQTLLEQIKGIKPAIQVIYDLSQIKRNLNAHTQWPIFHINKLTSHDIKLKREWENLFVISRVTKAAFIICASDEELSDQCHLILRPTESMDRDLENKSIKLQVFFRNIDAFTKENPKFVDLGYAWLKNEDFSNAETFTLAKQIMEMDTELLWLKIKPNLM